MLTARRRNAFFFFPSAEFYWGLEIPCLFRQFSGSARLPLACGRFSNSTPAPHPGAAVCSPPARIPSWLDLPSRFAIPRHPFRLPPRGLAAAHRAWRRQRPFRIFIEQVPLRCPTSHALQVQSGGFRLRMRSPPHVRLPRRASPHLSTLSRVSSLFRPYRRSNLDFPKNEPSFCLNI